MGFTFLMDANTSKYFYNYFMKWGWHWSDFTKILAVKYKGLVLLHEAVKLHIKISQVLMKDL